MSPYQVSESGMWAVSRMVIAVGMVLLMMRSIRSFQDQAKQIGGDEDKQFQQMSQGILMWRVL